MALSRNQKRLSRLLKKYEQGTATPEEMAFVEQYYQSFERHKNDTIEDEEEMRRRLFGKVRSRIGTMEKQGAVISIQRKSYVRAVASAAAVLLLIAALAWLYYGNSKGRDTMQTAARQTLKNDILPGTIGATLTLADGRQIVLDRAKNGLLTIQGTTNVSNTNGTLVYGGEDDGQLRYNTLTTHKGEQFPLVLSDGTRILIDAATTLRYPVHFSGRSREIELISGRAWFEVAKNKSMPFVVARGDRKIQVLGTQFNVSAYDNEPALKVTLVQGSVRVLNDAAASLLRPGQQAVMAKGSSRIDIVEDASVVEEAIAWKNGKISYRAADITTIVREIERWYDVDVEIRGDLGRRTFYFDVSRTVSLSELLQIFDIYHIRYSIDGEKRKLVMMP
jgi:transmembrane sensor